MEDVTGHGSHGDVDGMVSWKRTFLEEWDSPLLCGSEVWRSDLKST